MVQVRNAIVASSDLASGGALDFGTSQERHSSEYSEPRFASGVDWGALDFGSSQERQSRPHELGERGDTVLQYT